MKQYLKKEILFRHHVTEQEHLVQCGTVRGLSPSGKYVSVDYTWYDVTKISVLEVLPNEAPELEAAPVSVPPPKVPPANGTAAETIPTSSAAGQTNGSTTAADAQTQS